MSNRTRKIALVLAIVVIFCLIMSSCGSAKLHDTKEDTELWALIWINKAGEPIHEKVIDYTLSSSGGIFIYTEERVYFTSVENVLLIEGRS